jgi:hypothetical protein
VIDGRVGRLFRRDDITIRRKEKRKKGLAKNEKRWRREFKKGGEVEEGVKGKKEGRSNETRGGRETFHTRKTILSDGTGSHARHMIFGERKRISRDLYK